MRVIKKGQLESFSLKVQCKLADKHNGFTWDETKRHCNSILEIDQDDIELRSHHRNPSVQQCDFTIKCPECGCIIFINDGDLPHWVQAYAIEKFKNKKEEENERI